MKEMSRIESICIVIPTFNRAALLEQSLAKYSAIEHIDQIEILIVDNNSSDHTKQVVEQFTADSELNVRYHFEPKQGLSVAKNAAIQLVVQDYILFLDDDCYPENDILVHCSKHIRNGNAVVVGKINRWSEMVPDWILDEFFIENYPSENSLVFNEPRYFKGGISLLSVKVLKELNGFNESLGMSGSKSSYGEDTELAHRLLAEEIEMVYDPNIAMFHDSHHKTVRDFLQAYFKIGETHSINQPSLLRIFKGLPKAYLMLIISPITFVVVLIKHQNIKTAFVSTYGRIINYYGQFAGWALN